MCSGALQTRIGWTLLLHSSAVGNAGFIVGTSTLYLAAAAAPPL